MKKILFIHFRSGERDGVSLEMEKRERVLTQMGHEVHFLTGYDPRAGKSNRIHLLPQLDVKRRMAAFLRETFFEEKILDSHLAWLLYQSEEEKIYRQTLKVLKTVKPDLIYIHNILSLALHLPASSGILKALDHFPTKVIAVHHDFFWEREQYAKPRYDFIQHTLDALPPRRDYILEHQVINGLAYESLKAKRGIEAHQISGDYIDFDSSVASAIDTYNSDFRTYFGIDKHDILILHATRIVQRKAIENAILYAHHLQKALTKSAPFTFNGRPITKDSRVVLVLPNFIEADEQVYFRKLKHYAEKLGVRFLWIAEHIGLTRKTTNGIKIYSFWDCYPHADLVTYTSYLEGFGNQLLESFWAKKPLIVFEYPVFKATIKKEGYQVITLGDKMKSRKDFKLVQRERIASAAKETLNLLQNEQRYREMIETNYRIAQQNHHISHLRADLQLALDQ
ncbi:glycosyltransferase family 4 protein [Candidatus Roizmanbacteria bacterium]|nr:glycosyltransferase family 4 protein [Candidatus Roizmanbacteria bacterium]